MKEIDWGQGIVVYNEIDIDFTKPFYEQEDCLTEDLLQIQYGSEYLLDVGWYPEHQSQGYFVIQLIRSYNWDKPICYKKCNGYDKLIQDIQNVVKLANNLMTESNKG